MAPAASSVPELSCAAARRFVGASARKRARELLGDAATAPARAAQAPRQPATAPRAPLGPPPAHLLGQGSPAGRGTPRFPQPGYPAQPAQPPPAARPRGPAPPAQPPPAHLTASSVQLLRKAPAARPAARPVPKPASRSPAPAARPEARPVPKPASRPKAGSRVPQPPAGPPPGVYGGATRSGAGGAAAAARPPARAPVAKTRPAATAAAARAPAAARGALAPQARQPAAPPSAPRKRQAAPLDEAPPALKVAWLRLELAEDEDSELLDLAPEAPALCHEDCPRELLSGAHELLTELVGCIEAEVVFEDDANWDKFPEVGSAFRRAGGEEVSYNVAKCGAHRVWAVGVAGNWKRRAPVSKLALSLALALQANGSASREVLDRWPALGELCSAARAARRRGAAAAGCAAGAPADAGAAAYARKRARRAGRPDAPADEEPPPEPTEEDGAEMEAEEAELAAADLGGEEVEDHAEEPVSDGDAAQEEFQEGEEVPEAAQDEFLEGEEVPGEALFEYPEGAAGEMPDDVGADVQPQREATTLERDAPLWIRLPGVEPDTMPDELEGLPVEALVLSITNSHRPVYASADEALAELAGECIEEVEYFDDNDWSRFPAVGAALKGLADAEECFHVASCKSLGVWAVGVGMKLQNRARAAKVALAASLAIRMEEEGLGEPELPGPLRDLVALAHSSREEMREEEA